MQSLSTIELGALFTHKGHTWIRKHSAGPWSICRRVIKTDQGSYTGLGCDELINSIMNVDSFAARRNITIKPATL